MAPGAQPDLVLDLLLPRPLRGLPDAALEARHDRDIEEAVDALPAPTRRDPRFDDYVTGLEQLGQRGDHDEIATAYRAGTYAERCRIVNAVADAQDLEWAQAWHGAASHPDVAGVVVGLALWQAALDAEAEAEDWTPESVSAAYHSWAEEMLAETASQYPDDPTPLIAAQRMVSRGRSTRDTVLGKAAAWQRLDPFSVEGWCWMLQDLRPDRFGTPTDLDEAISRLVAQAPEADPVLGLVPFAVCEIYAAESQRTGNPAESDAVFVDRVDVVRQAHRRSVGSALWRPTPDEAMWRNCFAMALFYGNADAEAWCEFVRLHGLWTAHPWRLKGDDALGAYLGARAWLVRNLPELAPPA